MLPDLEILGLSLHSYYVLAALAAAAGLGSAWYTLKGRGLGAWHWLLPPLLGLAALIGGRLWNYGVNPAQFGPAFPLWSLHYGGFSLYGGLAGALLALLAFCLVKKTSPLPLLDALTLPGGLSLILLKLGCFLNGCCFGKAASGPLGLVFPANEEVYDFLESLPLLGEINRRVYPTQLFEAAGAALSLALVLLLGRRRKLPPGGTFLLYAFCFTLARLLIHPLRAFAYQAWVVEILYPAVYGLVLVAAALGLLLLKKHGNGPGPNQPPPPK